MSKKENVVQAAITGALEVFCSGSGRPQLELFPPYAVQQGSGLRKYCADLVGMLDDADVILLEIKECDCEKGILPRFDPKQHADNLRFETLGVPIAYAYNAKDPLPYHAHPRPPDWPSQTLAAIKRRLPSFLPNDTPNSSGHQTLLDWLLNVNGGDATAPLGEVHGAFKQANELRNGALVLLYGVERNVLISLTADQLDQVLKCLNEPWLQPKQIAKLNVLLGASARVFGDFIAQPAKPDPHQPGSSHSKKASSPKRRPR